MPGPKKAPRTKGNVKPSSSSQAALLLTAGGHVTTGFIGFSNNPAFVPASEMFDDAEAALDGEFRIVLRKLSKRDSVTKIKALHEFITLCATKEEDLVKAVVPFWPRLYNKLAIDIEHKVRELSQRALLALAEKTGKCLAPQLKSFMGLWMVAMCDTYPTVASAANTAFTNTFTSVKQVEAVQFCKADIVECLMNNILKATPETLSDPQTTSETDMGAKYERVVSSSLLAFRKLITILPADTVTTFMSEHIDALLSSSAFWKHTKSTTISIKSGLLSLLAVVCQLCPDASSKAVNKIAPFVISNLDASDPTLISYTWEATLSMIKAHQDCWEHINWQKAMWPKIKHILESGCSGQAAIVSPCLLPLLSKIVNLNYRQFFDSFRMGLCAARSLYSPSDTNALVKSFTECIHYSIQSINNSGNDCSDVRDLILSQLLLVVQASLTEQQLTLSKTDLYVSLSILLEVSNNIRPGTEQSFWSELSTFVVEKLEAEYQLIVERCQDTSTVKQSLPFFQCLNFLMQGLVFQETSSATKERVKFAQEDTRTSNKKSNNLGKKKHKLSSASETFVSDILVTVFELAMASEHAAPLFMGLFKDLSFTDIPVIAAQRLADESKVTSLALDPSQNLLNCAEENVKSELPVCGTDNAHQRFLCKKAIKLLLYAEKNKSLRDLGGGKFTDDLVLITLAFVSYVDAEEGTIFFSYLLENVQDSQITCQLIQHILSHSPVVPACYNLLQGTQVSKKIKEVTLAGIETNKSQVNGSNIVWKMLTSVLDILDSSNNDLLSQSCLDSAISSCLSILKEQQVSENNRDTLVPVINLTKKILDTRKVWTHPQLGELVLSFFSLLLANKNSELVEEVNSVWKCGFDHIVEKKSDTEIHQHISQMSQLIKAWICLPAATLSGLSNASKAVKSVVTHVSSFCEDQGNKSEYDLTVLSSTIDSFLILDQSQFDGVNEVYQLMYMEGGLSHLPPVIVSPPVSLVSYTLISIHNLRALVLNKDFQMKGSQDDGYHWSRGQLQSMTELALRLYLLDKHIKLHPNALKDMADDLTSVKKDLADCMATLREENFSTVYELISQSQDDQWCSYSCGIKSILEPLVQVVEKPGSIHLFDAYVMFLSKCVDSDLAIKLIENLKTSGIVKESIQDNLAISVSYLLGTHIISLSKLAETLSGWLSLSLHHNLLNEELKMSFLQTVLDIVKKLKEKDIHLLSGSDVTASQENIHWNCQAAKILKTVIVPTNQQYWEFTLCTLAEWIQFLSEASVCQESDVVTKSLLVAVCALVQLASETFSQTSAQEIALTERARTEWNEFFSEGVFSPLLPLFVSSAATTSGDLDPCWSFVLHSLASAASLCPHWLVLAHQLPAKLTATDTSSIPDSMKTLLNHLSPLLMFKLRTVEVVAYTMLWRIMEEIPKYEESQESDNKQEEEIRAPPEALIEQVESAGHFLNCLKVVQIDDHILMDSDTEEHAQAMGYLLAWRLLLHLFRSSGNQMRAKYAQYFKINNSVSHLLDHLFRLMPQHPSSSILDLDYQLDINNKGNDFELGYLALSVYRQCLEILPALVRSWWVDQDRKASNFIDRFTTQYISSGLIRQQITSAQGTENGMADITIRGRPAAREVSATYQMAEVTINMSIVLPENYPLGKLDVTCDKRVGVSQAQWDRWLLQLNIFLQHQNGSIVEGLRLWKGNIDKKFEGIEDCMICFSVIHGTTFQLPKLTCRTCKKKFHSACLYKWFNTSQKSSCPLCRDLF
ncbi:unnamed protein product [Lymnaea stagnalis]|uniref:E3 ubiquitin-protein ligase listerin n=1 Tax=Lymnaea stagnalis TaxID=6523 RepID=A0AAV2HNM9_LYMST